MCFLIFLSSTLAHIHVTNSQTSEHNSARFRVRLHIKGDSEKGINITKQLNTNINYFKKNM